MYLKHYNLTMKPFEISPDPKFLWLGEKHKEALAAMKYGILDNKGFISLTGDVGTGKTVVALLAAVAAIDAGGQAAIMAPTEILAAQHARTVLRLLPGIRPVLLTGAASVRERSALLAALGRGDGELAIGTHALFSDDVRFRRLTLVVVDEQQQVAGIITDGDLIKRATAAERSGIIHSLSRRLPLAQADSGWGGAGGFGLHRLGLAGSNCVHHGCLVLYVLCD